MELVSADDVIAKIDAAEIDPLIDGILLRIDSPGGSAAGGEAIANRLKASELPTVAFIREIGTSAAYLAATGADTIVASQFADVGGIGFTMSYLEYSQQNGNDGATYIPLTSGPYKDSGSPDKPLTNDERILFQRDLDIFHDLLTQEIASNRGIDIAEIQKLADGSTLPASLHWTII